MGESYGRRGVGRSGERGGNVKGRDRTKRRGGGGDSIAYAVVSVRFSRHSHRL